MKKERKTLRVYKADDWDHEQIQKKADRHARGNLSAWLRHAGRMYTPKRGEKVLKKAG